MKENIIRLAFAAVLLMVLQMSLFPQEKLKIAVIPKSNTALFWKLTHAGAKLGAVASGGVEVVWRAPTMENDITKQISIVDQCVAEGVSGIVLAPLDNKALAESVAKATKKKIPVLIFDSALKGTAGKDFISFVSVDNKNAGILAGEHLIRLLGGKGKIVMLRYMVSKSNISDREEGFLEVMAKHDGIQVIEKNCFVSGTVDEATSECMKINDKLKDADGIFCSYEQSTVGMLFALRKLNLAGKIKFIGFDTPAPAIEALKKGEISALVAQDPARMGFLGVKTIVDHIRGKKVPLRIDTDVHLILRENLNYPDIQKLLALPVIEE
ncbi:MAG: substrate-binding domain-containing protein [Bacteroidota bacterium]